MQYKITATVIRQLLQKSTACLPQNCAKAFKPAKKLPRNGCARAGFWSLMVVFPFREAAWVAFAPNFCSAMFGPTLGKLADLYGRARCWWAGMTLFVTSFLICANAQSIYLMIFGRILSGLGWAATGPAGFGILASTLERSQRGVASAMMTSTGTLGSSIGVAVGGVLMDLGSWRLYIS
jgi:MFS family permease